MQRGHSSTLLVESPLLTSLTTSNYLSLNVDKDAKTNIKRNRYKYKYNKKKQKCKEDMEAHYYWWEPAASFSLSLNPPNNCQPSTQYALSLSLMMATYHDDDVVKDTRIQEYKHRYTYKSPQQPPPMMMMMKMLLFQKKQHSLCFLQYTMLTSVSSVNCVHCIVQ